MEGTKRLVVSVVYGEFHRMDLLPNTLVCWCVVVAPLDSSKLQPSRIFVFKSMSRTVLAGDVSGHPGVCRRVVVEVKKR